MSRVEGQLWRSEVRTVELNGVRIPSPSHPELKTDLLLVNFGKALRREEVKRLVEEFYPEYELATVEHLKALNMDPRFVEIKEPMRIIALNSMTVIRGETHFAMLNTWPLTGVKIEQLWWDRRYLGGHWFCLVRKAK